MNYSETDLRQLIEENQRLKKDNDELRGKEADAVRYIRQKVDQLLVVMGTLPLRPEELDDASLLSLDPIGIISGSFAQVLKHLKETNIALELARDEIQVIFDSVGSNILVLDKDMRVIAFNQQMGELFPEGLGNPAGKYCREALCVDHKACELCVVQRVLESCDTATVSDWQYQGRSFDIIGTPIKDRSGNVAQIVVLYLETTERLCMEEALRESEERYRDLFENANDLVHIVAPDGTFLLVNEAWRKAIGYGPEEIEKIRLFDIFHPDCMDKCVQQFKRIMAGENVGVFESSLKSKDGKEIVVESTVNCRLDDQGRILYMRGIMRDVTAVRQHEKELRRIENLESIGLLAGGIAHDFNNLLTSFLGNVSLAKMHCQAGGYVYDLLGNAEKATMKARSLTQQLLTFSKGGAPIKKAVSVKQLLDDSTSFVLRGSSVKYVQQCSQDLWSIEVDEGQLSQVIQNLVINGSQAMPHGGVITITSENVVVGDGSALPLPQGKYVKITVSDQGIGISKENREKIFDPYFTTKETGNGLGLSIVHSIIKRHEGYIAVESEQGRGTSFFIYLPASEVAPVMEKESLHSQPAATKHNDGGTVLVMDDDALVRQVSAKMLERIGYKADFACDGEEAITMYSKAKHNGCPFDAVILDLTVPGGMGGRDAVRELLQIDPAARVIVSSGYANDPVMADYREYGFCEVIPKPFRLEELAQKLTFAISGSSPQ